jgi:formate-dependent nitrite reductase membrane component NrfD
MTAVASEAAGAGARADGGADRASYYGRPVIKPPVWKPDIAVYLFAGGLAGASATLATLARRAGNERLARSANLAAAAAISVSPPLLIHDLGRPARFLNMLRVAKPTSPMNVGSWLLTAEGTASGIAATCELLGRLPRVRTGAERVAGLLGPLLATYTGVLLADTAVPVWHEARRELPLLFAGGAAASAGAAAVLLTPSADAGPARRMLVAGAAVEEAANLFMERRLGPLGEPYRTGRAGRIAKAARALTLAGGTHGVLGGRRSVPARGAAVLTLAGALAHRFAIFEAGFQSARDPRATVEPQRERLRERGLGRGAPDVP